MSGPALTLPAINRFVSRLTPNAYRSFSRVVSCTLGLSLAACTAYAPAGRPARDGERVQLFLNDRGRTALGATVGAATRSVAGAVTSLADSSLTLAVSATRSINGAEYEWTGESVTVPLTMLDSVRVQHVSFVRTALVTGAVLGGVALIRAAFSNFGKGGDGGRSPSPSPQ